MDPLMVLVDFHHKTHESKEGQLQTPHFVLTTLAPIPLMMITLKGLGLISGLAMETL